MARAIDQFLAAIRQAIYGRDVREAIASGIEQCYDDSTANAQKADIEAKGAEVLASIPDTYEALQTDVDNLKDTVDLASVAETTSYMDLSESGKPADEITVSGSTPTINALKNTMYLCGMVSSISFTPSSEGLSAVRFTSGTTPAVLIVPNTVIWPEWFDPNSLSASITYELNVHKGIYGVVATWQ